MARGAQRPPVSFTSGKSSPYMHILPAGDKSSVKDELRLPKLKAVLRRELQTPLLRPDRVLARDLPKGGIGDGCVWIPVTDNVEGVESIEAELECLLFEGGETLEGRQVHIEIPRTAHRAIARGPKG